jgi:hypothetical protein
MSTIKVDTVRPVTTDGSLTLQGDSSGSGVTGITIDNAGDVTINNGTLGSGVTFPAGHILQSLNAAVTNVDNTAVVSDYVADVIDQITINSGNYVKITVFFTIQFSGSTNCVGTLAIHEGTVASPSTQLFSTVAVGDAQNSNYITLPVAFSFIDTSPASTTPDYCFQIAKSSGGTTNLKINGTPTVILEEINV